MQEPSSAPVAPIGVVIPMFDRADTILRTLESVAAQTLQPTQTVIVDDGSTDGSAEVVASWISRNPSLDARLLRQTNQGVSAARNTGWQAVRHLALVAFLDSDDVWPEDFLERGSAALSQNDSAVAAVADRLMVSDCGEWQLESRLSDFAADPLPWLFQNDAGLLSCMLFRVEHVSQESQAALFDPRLASGEDIEFLGRLCFRGPLCKAECRPVLFYRDIKKSRTGASNLSESQSDGKYQWAIVYEGLYRQAASRLTLAQRRGLHKGLAKKWRAAGLQDILHSRHRRAAWCFLRAWRWRPTNLSHLLRALTAVGGRSSA